MTKIYQIKKKRKNDLYLAQLEWRVFEFNNIASRGNVEDKSEVNVHDLPCTSFQQNIRGVPISEAQDVSDHAVDSKRTSISCSTL